MGRDDAPFQTASTTPCDSSSQRDAPATTRHVLRDGRGGRPGARRRGLAAELLGGMRELQRRRGLRRMIAPVRPSWKERYPLAPIERYITWRRADGQLLDPWMRLHERLGARVATALPQSMRITGRVDEWEAWPDLPLPESGEYVFPAVWLR